MHRYFEVNGGGHNIRCKLYYRELTDVRQVVVFCHGFGGHKDNTAAEKFAGKLLAKRKGAVLVTFNWPCHGDDVKKKLSLADCDTYLTLVLEHLRRRFPGGGLYAYATSFGGYLTLKYISDHGSPFRKIALRCPAVNMHQVLTATIMSEGDLERIEKGGELLVGFDRKIPIGQPFLEQLLENDIRERDFLDWAEDILILHGTADEIVPFTSVQSFAEEQLTEFIPVENADHRFHDPVKMDLAIKYILEFFG